MHLNKCNSIIFILHVLVTVLQCKRVFRSVYRCTVVSKQADLGREIHALSCASKPLGGWIARDAIQESREACGGHGYFKGKLMYSELLHTCRVIQQAYVSTMYTHTSVKYPMTSLIPFMNAIEISFLH